MPFEALTKKIISVTDLKSEPTDTASTTDLSIKSQNLYIGVDGDISTKDIAKHFSFHSVLNLILGSKIYNLPNNLALLHIDHHSTPFKAQPYHYLNTIYNFITGRELFRNGEAINHDIKYWLSVFENLLDKIVLSICNTGFNVVKVEGLNYATPRPDGDSICTLFLQYLLFEKLPNDFIVDSRSYNKALNLESKYNKWKVENLDYLKRFVTLMFQVSFWGDNFGFLPNDPYFSDTELKELRKISRSLNMLASNSSDESILKGLKTLNRIYESRNYSLQGNDRLSYEEFYQQRQGTIHDLVKIIDKENIFNGVVLIDVSELEKSKNLKIDAELCQIAFEEVLQKEFDSKGATRPSVQPILMIKRNDPSFDYYSLSTFTIHDHQHFVPNIIQDIFKRLNIAEKLKYESQTLDLDQVFEYDITSQGFYENSDVLKRWAGGNFAGGSSKVEGTKLNKEQISLIISRVLGANAVAIPDLSQLSEE